MTDDQGTRDTQLPTSEEGWKERLTPEQFRVARKKGTERAFSGQFWDCEKTGEYCCVGCGQSLFDSSTKFDSGTGWPSFWEPITPASVATKQDSGWFMRRTEVHCSRCGAHLGHVFADGPKPTGQRYCINSVVLQLNQRGES